MESIFLCVSAFVNDNLSFSLSLSLSIINISRQLFWKEKKTLSWEGISIYRNSLSFFLFSVFIYADFISIITRFFPLGRASCLGLFTSFRYRRGRYVFLKNILSFYASRKGDGSGSLFLFPLFTLSNHVRARNMGRDGSLVARRTRGKHPPALIRPSNTIPLPSIPPAQETR